MRVINNFAWHNLFARNMFIQMPREREIIRSFVPEFTILHCPNFNADDPNDMWMKTQTSARVFTFGFSEDADTRCVSVNSKSFYKPHICISIDGSILELNTGLIGKVMIYPILAEMAVAWIERMDLSKVTSFPDGLI